MKLTLLSVGDKLPAWANAAVAEYLKRMPREARVDLVEIKPEKRAGQSADSIKAIEAARLLDKLPAGSRLVALDEHGRAASTRELADLLARWMAEGRDVALVIGGADGLAHLGGEIHVPQFQQHLPGLHPIALAYQEVGNLAAALRCQLGAATGLHGAGTGVGDRGLDPAHAGFRHAHFDRLGLAEVLPGGEAGADHDGQQGDAPGPAAQGWIRHGHSR